MCTTRPPQPQGQYDLELPILGELEVAFERELRILAPKAPRRLAQRLRPDPPRVVRRALVLVGLVSLVGTSALAGRAVLADSHAPVSSAPSLQSSGGRGAARWQLTAYLYEGSVCYALFLADNVSSECGAPGGSGVRASSALGPTRRMVAGLAGADVAQVLVRVGHHDAVLSTYPLEAASGARHARLPAGLRWFAISLASARAGPALLTPRNAAGRALGAPVLDCSIGGTSALCQRAATALAGPSGQPSGSTTG